MKMKAFKNGYTRNAARVSAPQEPCVLCGRGLDISDATLHIELHNMTHEMHKPGSLEDDNSQGCFPIGSDCAKLAKVAELL